MLTEFVDRYWRYRIPAVRICTAAHPMPLGDSSDGWVHPDAAQLAVLMAPEDGVLVDCPHCGFLWTEPRPC